MFRIACSRKFTTSRPLQRSSQQGSFVQKYGIGTVYAYGALSAIELPLLLGLVHYTGTDWMQNLELKVRSVLGFDTNEHNTFIGRVETKKGGQFVAELASAFVLHKMLLVVRLPLSVALAPYASKTFGRGASQPLQSTVANPSPGAQGAAGNGAAGSAAASSTSGGQGTISGSKANQRNFGTAANKRNKWMSWFF